jgi:3'(2'), 5'-bisphosphate nucleotidase
LTDEDVAAWLAEEAGRLLMELREATSPGDPKLGVMADKAANAFILGSLEQWRPDDPILSEESPDLLERLESERVWIIDPLDGTREYAEGRDDWAVHVALAVGGVPRVGAVALPAKGQVYRSDGCEVPQVSRDRPLMVVSRTRPPAEVEAIAHGLGAELVAMGSAGAKAMAVVAGDADLYYHSGGQHEWDNCAPAAVAIGAGLRAIRVDGSPLVYNCRDTLVPDLIIARRELAEKVVALCKSIGESR